MKNLRKCAYDKCDVQFEPTKHNMKYHSDKCCKAATNEEAMRKYYARKDRKKKQTGHRICSECKVTVLSRYNPSPVCQACEVKDADKQRVNLLDMLNK